MNVEFWGMFEVLGGCKVCMGYAGCVGWVRGVCGLYVELCVICYFSGITSMAALTLDIFIQTHIFITI